MFFACAFQGYGNLKYIVAQGPLPNTVEDFWRMVWEYKLTTVVMLTKCYENEKVWSPHDREADMRGSFFSLSVCMFQAKSECYWPLEVGQSKEYGSAHIVTLQSVVMCTEYDIRTLTVTQVSGKQYALVLMVVPLILNDACNDSIGFASMHECCLYVVCICCFTHCTVITKILLCTCTFSIFLC